MSKNDKLLKRIEFYEKMASSEKSNSDELLNKVSFYERLSLYSDRGSFLRALAQTPPGEGGIQASLDALVNAVQNWISTSAEKQGDLPGSPRGLPPSMRNPFANVQNAARYKSLDIDMLDKVKYQVSELAAVNKNLRDASRDIRHSWINTVLPAATNTLSLLEKQVASLNEWKRSLPPDQTPTDVGTGKLEVPEVTVEGTPPAKALPPINTQDQQAVFQFAIEEGELVPDPAKQRADGRIGPETRKALEGVKNYFAKRFPQNPRMTDQQAITAAKTPRRQ